MGNPDSLVNPAKEAKHKGNQDSQVILGMEDNNNLAKE